MEDIDFFIPEQKPFGQTILVFDEHSKLNHKNIVLSGFPYDLGTQASGHRLGAAKGPQIFRQCLLTYDLVQKNYIPIYDAGNIQRNCQKIVQAHRQLTHKHKTIFQIQSQNKADCCIVSFGGSHDQCLANVKSLLESYPGKKIGLIVIDSHIDWGKQQIFQLSDENYLLQILQHIQPGKFCMKVFGINKNCRQFFRKQQEIQILQMEKYIRNIQKQQIQREGLKTQGGTAFKKAIKNIQRQVDVLMVSFDARAVQSKWMPGVSIPNVNNGFLNDEVFQIMKIIGRCSKIKLLEISNFNPSIQSKLSGAFLIQMFYQFCQSYGST